MENQKQKVSVIVPIYNVVQYLPQCIESLCMQTYENIEIILVDDGSTDGGGYICDQYAERDQRIKVIHKKNNGVSAARNDGIRESVGSYICFVDGDDYVMPDYVQYMLRLATQYNTDVALSTEIFTNFDLDQSRNISEKVYTGEQATESILCYDMLVGVNNKIYRRSLLEKGIQFLEDLYIGEGFNFNTTAFQKATNVAIGNRKIYYYRKDNANSVTTRFDASKWENGLHAIQLIRQNLILYSERLERAWEFAWWRTNTDVYDLLILADAKTQYPEMYHDCRQVMKKYKFSCFYAPTSLKQRIRAIIMWICPVLIPWAMIVRRKKYKVNIGNKGNQ